MTTTATAPADPGTRRWSLTRAVASMLLVGWVVALVPLSTGFEREVSYDRLQRDLRSGEVEAVTLGGDLLGREEYGYSEIVLSWSRGWWSYRTRVEQVRGGADVQVPDGSATITGSVAAALHELDPEVVVSRGGSPARSTFTVMDQEVPGVLGVALFGLLLVTLGLLIGGPQPRRATRWAWFWLLVPPFGCLAFLLLGGAVTGREHRPGEQRLQGGLAFVLVVVLSALVKNAMR